MWDQEEIYFETEAYFDAVCRRIDGAQHSVEVEMYIFRRDALGTSLLNYLLAAADRGVMVRLLIDGIGSPGWSIDDLEALHARSLLVRVYHPLPFSRLFRSTWSNPLRGMRLLSKINRRTHRKTIVIDNREAFVGSMNVDEDHKLWRETAVHIVGAQVSHLRRSYEWTWSRSYSPVKEIRTRVSRRLLRRSAALNVLVRINTTMLLRRRQNGEFLARILLARQRVWITTAYFVPNPRVIQHLIYAARAGADVCLLLPRKSDVRFVRWVSQLFYWSLLKSGVRVYEYLPTVLHAKTVIIDDWVTVGTTNLNYRSLYHDLEVDVVLTKKTSRDRLIIQFYRDLACSSQVTEKWLKSRPVLVRVGAYIAALLRWWI